MTHIYMVQDYMHILQMDVFICTWIMKNILI
jgi:hypothetical protein